MTAKLIAEEGALKGLILSLENGKEWVIGRDPDSCQLLIEDPAASRRHLICRVSPEGIVLENLSATNPVQVNYEEIKKPYLLSDGDLVKIGSGLFRFYSEPEVQLISEEEQEEQNEENEEENTSFYEKSDESEFEPSHSEESVQESSLENFSITPKDLSFSQEEPSITPNDLSISQEEPSMISKDLSAVLDEQTDNHEEIFSDDSSFYEDEDRNTNPILKRHESIFQDSTVEDEKTQGKGFFTEIDFNLSDTGRWLLKVIGGPNTGAEFSMREGHTYVLGTDPNSCDVVFNDTSVSRQHIRITVSDDGILTIEDLRSRNGTLVDGKSLETKLVLESNVVVNLGTSSFVIYDKEAEMHTIISPLLPSIVKVLQKEDYQHATPTISKEIPIPPKETENPLPEQPAKLPKLNAEEIKEKNSATLTAFIFIAIITGAFVLMGIGIVTLFQTNPVELKEEANANQLISEALTPFPSIEWIYNKSTGSLLLVGHVLTDDAKRQLLYNLEGFSFLKNIDSHDVIVDEKVWQEVNSNLARNPAWRGVTLQATTPGKFVLTGYLQNRTQMESLMEEISRNFLYLDKLEYRVLVEEDILEKVKQSFAEAGISGIKISMSNRVLVLQGVIPTKMHDEFEKVLAKISETPSLKNIQNYVTEIPEARSLQDISDRYLVTGVSRSGKNYSVVIDGRILSKGDVLDGMTITEINNQAVLLEKDGINYRIALRP